MNHNNTEHKKQRLSLLAALLSIVVYGIVFMALYYMYGAGMPIAATIPVMLIAWLYGLKAGVAASILSFPVNVIMYELLGMKGLECMLFGGGGVPGTINLLVIAAAIGYARDLAAKLRSELKEREIIEKELKEHRNKLNEMVMLKTKELEESNKKLLEEKEYSSMLIETADVVITGVDAEGKVVLLNKKAEEVTGYSREEVKGKEFVKVFVADAGRHAFNDLIQKIKEGRITHPVDAQIMTKHGEERTILSRGTPLENREGEIIGILGIGIDVTSTRKMETQLLRAEKLKSLGELAGGVAHDVNNVLAAILGRVQLLKSQITSPPSGKQEKRKSTSYLKAGLETIERASLDGAETVRRIQEFSRKRTDEGDYTRVDINELLNNALDYTRTRWKDDAQAKAIRIRIHKKYGPLIHVAGRPSELREVFTNLINNAIDAISEGGDIRIKTFTDNGHAVITVADTGSGIPETIKERIFDPFFTTKDVHSTGLGLSVSYGIINRHHGTITSGSVEGGGAIFTITLPVAKQQFLREVKGKKGIPAKLEYKKARILVIEDEENIRQLLKDILTNAGHEVEIATDGSEGVKIFEKKKFDLVFTDLGMPLMSGWQVAEKVKNLDGKVPVVLITGWNVKLEKSEMEECGISLVIQKPFKMGQVLSLVQEGMLLRERSSASHASQG